MAILSSEWQGRLNHWIRTLKMDLYEPLGEIRWDLYRTMEELSLEEACAAGPYEPVEKGTSFGFTYEYGWLRSTIVMPEKAKGSRIVLNLEPGGESTIFVNGRAFGTYRADWVREKHHYMADNWITSSARPGETYDLMVEVYCGHYFPQAPQGGCATGPVLPGSYQDPKTEGKRITLGTCTYGIWNEDAYQLLMDVETLYKLLDTLDETSLRAASIADALEEFTKIVDFEQDKNGRIATYQEARKALAPALACVNGSTMPQFFAVGNSHLDLAWLWPMHETYRKTARTFAAQLRLLEEYPDYIYIQSQPASYEMCRRYYPELFERIKKAIKEGRWIADGAMWVEPDTNMASGEALIRQLVYGKRYYKEELGVESETLWLPDTFGYTAALPQILSGCHVKYLVTQKIFWSYNDGEKFPYHYFTWEGMDGSKVTSFLPTSYTYYTSPTEANNVWKTRTQKRDLPGFLFPYGYGDGGGGPTRDYVEYVHRQKDLEGGVRMKHASPRQFFEAMDEMGGPKHTYRGELYFSAHRGTFTTQALVKRNNRKAELGLREMEFWGSLSDVLDMAAYPMEADERLWKETLLHQFHDILPGSGIGRIYREAEERMGKVIEEAGKITDDLVVSLTKDQEGYTVFNSLSFDRNEVVTIPPCGDGSDEEKKVLVHVPACGFAPVKEVEAEKAQAVKNQDGTFTLKNGVVTALINEKGEVISFKRKDSSREFAAAPMNVFRFFKDIPRLYDAWDIDSNYGECEIEGLQDAFVTIAEEEGAEASLMLRGTIGNSKIEQKIVLAQLSSRIEFRTIVDWKELHRLLKAAFPVNVYSDNVINEIQFGYIERPVHRSRPYDQDRFEVCNHRYSALCDNTHGAAVLNESKYGMSANGNSLELTLLRAAASPELPSDNHVHEFTYAFTAFEGPFVQSDVVRQGLELNVPVKVMPGTAEAFSAFAVESESVILDTVKQAEDGSKDLVLRLYESKKAAGKACLVTKLPVKKAFVCDMLENPEQLVTLYKEGEKTYIDLDFRAFEIKTLRLETE